MVEVNDWNRNLSKLLEIHVYFFILIASVRVIAVNIKILQKQVVSLQRIFFLSIHSEDKIDPVMKIFSDVLTL